MSWGRKSLTSATLPNNPIMFRRRALLSENLSLHCKNNFIPPPSKNLLQLMGVSSVTFHMVDQACSKTSSHVSESKHSLNSNSFHYHGFSPNMYLNSIYFWSSLAFSPWHPGSQPIIFVDPPLDRPKNLTSRYRLVGQQYPHHLCVPIRWTAESWLTFHIQISAKEDYFL